MNNLIKILRIPLKKLLYYFVFFSLVTYFEAAFADLDQAKIWSGTDITGPLFRSKKVVYDLFIQARSNLSRDEYDETLVEGTLGYKITPDFTLWLGYTSDIPGVFDYENDIWQQATWNIINYDRLIFASRTRLEERKNDRFDPWAATLRQMLILSFPKLIFHKLKLALFDELFFNLNHPVWVNPETINQNRAFIGIGIPITKHASLVIGYLNQYAFRRPVNQDNHILWANLDIITK